MLSATSTLSFLPLLSPPKTNGSTVAIQLSSQNFPSSSSTLFGVNRNWSSHRYRSRAHSADPGKEFQTPTRFSPENERNPEDAGSSPSSSFLSVLCPLLKIFSGGDPSQRRNSLVEESTSFLSSLARFPWGSRALSTSQMNQETSTTDPPKRLQLFEFEACPFCRRVREAITELDLSVEIYPCPKGSRIHRDIVRRLGGKEQFPFLVDPNTGVSLYESGEIVNYLFQRYGNGRSPSFGLLESILFTGWMPTLLRAGRGMMLWERARSEPPSEKLVLFSYENNPYARIVREALCELELPYIHQTVGEGSGRTDFLLKASGSKEVPYIIDPNTGTQIGDYKKILSYLFQTYSIAGA